MDKGRAIAFDDSGSFYTATNGLGPYGSITMPQVQSVLAKHSQNGQVIWAVGMANASAASVSPDKFGNVYLTGQTFGTGTFYGVAASVTVQTPDSDGFLAKYDASGDIQWVKTFGGTNDYDDSRLVKTDALGNIYVSGNSSKSQTTPQKVNYFLKKFDPYGVFQWESTSEWIDWVLVGAMDIDVNDNIYVTGDFNDSAKFGGTTLTTPYAGAIFLVKYSPSGNITWVQKKGSNGGAPRGISIDDSSNIYITGVISRPCNIDGIQIPSNGTVVGCMFVAKLDSNGVAKWVRSAEALNPFSIACNKTGLNFVTGAFYNGTASTFMSSAGSTLTSSKKSEIFVLCYDGSGSFQWAAVPSGPKGELNNSYGIDCDLQGNPWITGSITHETSFGSYTIQPSNPTGLPDAIIAKLDTAESLTSISKAEILLNGIRVFPTITKRYVYLEQIPVSPTEYNITITNFFGQVVLEETIESSTASQAIDLLDLCPGVYFLRVKTDAGESGFKIIRQD
jgi:hypothetical protein